MDGRIDMSKRRISLALILTLAVGLCPGTGCFGDGDGGDACLQGGASNASARVNGMKVEFIGTSKVDQAMAPTPVGPVWVPQWTLYLDINLVECDHRLAFMVRNPGPGVADMSSHSVEGVSTYTAIYSGELGAESITNESTFEITSYGSTVSGKFKAVLPDGTVFEDGKFSGIPGG